MNVIRHDDEVMQFVEPFSSIVLQGVEQQGSIGLDLEQTAAVIGNCGNENGASVGGSRRVRHERILAAP